MDLSVASSTKAEDEKARQLRRAALRELNLTPFHQGRSLSSFTECLDCRQKCGSESSKLDSSLKRHTALIKRMRQSIGAENHDQIVKDIESLALEKYIDELSGAAVEGVGRCKSEKDVWSAVEVRL